MTPAMIFAILQGVLGAAPQLLALFQAAQNGKAVAAADVAAVLSQFGLDRAIFAAAIAKAEAEQGLGQQTAPAAKPTS